VTMSVAIAGSASLSPRTTWYMRWTGKSGVW
jgi:hypothetical protein